MQQAAGRGFSAGRFAFYKDISTTTDTAFLLAAFC
jgi:hypothetical protein